MKLGQNVCLDEISDEFENGNVRSKTRSLGQIIEELMLVTKYVYVTSENRDTQSIPDLHISDSEMYICTK